LESRSHSGATARIFNEVYRKISQHKSGSYSLTITKTLPKHSKVNPIEQGNKRQSSEKKSKITKITS